MLLGALAIGFVSSLHCVGMCGPIAMIVASKNKRLLFGQVAYNLGRVVTYSLLGILIGSVGWGIIGFGWQGIASVVCGVLILGGLLFPHIERWFLPAISGAISWLKRSIKDSVARGGFLSSFTTGLFNGLLPCGMVYMAMAMAILQNTPLDSASFMAAFGFGTFPAMLVVGLSGQFLSRRMPSWKTVQTVVTFAAGVFLIARGLLIESPAFSEFLGVAPLCN